MRTAIVTISDCPSCGGARHQEFLILEEDGREVRRWPSEILCVGRCTPADLRRVPGQRAG